MTENHPRPRQRQVQIYSSIKQNGHDKTLSCFKVYSPIYFFWNYIKNTNLNLNFEALHSLQYIKKTHSACDLYYLQTSMKSQKRGCKYTKIWGKKLFCLTAHKIPCEQLNALLKWNHSADTVWTLPQWQHLMGTKL